MDSANIVTATTSHERFEGLSFLQWVKINQQSSEYADFDHIVRFSDAISHAQFVNILAEAFTSNKKNTEEVWKSFPRFQDIDDAIALLRNTSFRPQESCKSKNGKALAKWRYCKGRFTIGKSTESIPVPENAPTCRLWRQSHRLYEILNTKDEKHYQKFPGKLFQAPVSALEESYVHFITCHISKNQQTGKYEHRGRDDTRRNLMNGISSSFKTNLIDRIIKQCPGCQHRQKGGRKQSPNGNVNANQSISPSPVPPNFEELPDMELMDNHSCPIIQSPSSNSSEDNYLPTPPREPIFLGASGYQSEPMNLEHSTGHYYPESFPHFPEFQDAVGNSVFLDCGAQDQQYFASETTTFDTDPGYLPRSSPTVILGKRSHEEQADGYNDNDSEGMSMSSRSAKRHQAGQLPFFPDYKSGQSMEYGQSGYQGQGPSMTSFGLQDLIDFVDLDPLAQVSAAGWHTPANYTPQPEVPSSSPDFDFGNPEVSTPDSATSYSSQPGTSQRTLHSQKLIMISGRANLRISTVSRTPLPCNSLEESVPISESGKSGCIYEDGS